MVGHGGESMVGDFCWSVTVTDIRKPWMETRANRNKGQHQVRRRMEEFEEELAFLILGFDSGNGGEFLHRHLRDYFCETGKPMQVTRSRPYRKNDNARVEKKNWILVRRRGWFNNLFRPAMKHLRTEVEGNRKKRVYD